MQSQTISIEKGVQSLPAEIRELTLLSVRPDDIIDECRKLPEMSRICGNEKFWERYAKTWGVVGKPADLGWHPYIGHALVDPYRYGSGVRVTYWPAFGLLNISLGFEVGTGLRDLIFSRAPELTEAERTDLGTRIFTLLSKDIPNIPLARSRVKMAYIELDEVEVANESSRAQGAGEIIIKYHTLPQIRFTGKGYERYPEIEAATKKVVDYLDSSGIFVELSKSKAGDLVLRTY